MLLPDRREAGSAYVQVLVLLAAVLLVVGAIKLVGDVTDDTYECLGDRVADLGGGGACASAPGGAAVPMAPPSSTSSSYFGSFGRFLSDLGTGAVEGDYSGCNSWGCLIGQVGIGFVPFAGQAADGRDISAALQGLWTGESGVGTLAMAGVALAPGVGDLAKGVVKGIAGPGDEVVEAVGAAAARADTESPSDVLQRLSEERDRLTEGVPASSRDGEWRARVTPRTSIVRAIDRAELETLLGEGTVRARIVDGTIANPIGSGPMTRHQNLVNQTHVRDAEGRLRRREAIGPVQGGRTSPLIPVSAGGPASSGYTEALQNGDRFLVKFKDHVHERLAAGNNSVGETEYLVPYRYTLDDVEWVADIKNDEWLYGAPGRPGSGRPPNGAPRARSAEPAPRRVTAAERADALIGRARALARRAGRQMSPAARRELRREVGELILRANNAKSTVSLLPEEKAAALEEIAARLDEILARSGAP